MAALKLSRINLLPKDSFEFSSLGKVLKWSLTSGRVLVVLTEFVVILAFGSRFYFDKKLNDLLEVIEQKQAVVDSYAEIEAKIRDILARQQIVTKYLTTNLLFESKLSQIKRVTPPDVSFSEVVINTEGINLTGTAGSENGFASLIAGINGLPEVANVSIGGVDFDQRQGSINFKISISLSPPQS